MKLSLAARFGAVIALTGMLAAGLTGYYGYQASRQMLLAAAEERLLTATRVLARQLTVELNSAARDVLLFAEHPVATQLLLRSEPPMQERSARNTAILFERLLATHPEYFQVRLIDTDSYGLEVVRVDRLNEGVRRVPDAELQEKGHYAYVYETIRLPRGSVYVARASINHETGAHAGSEKPVLQVAAPVYDAQQQVRGVLVINVDLAGLFRQLAADLPAELQLYLMNGQGDYLIHPVAAKAFAFDRGQQARVVEDFPATSALLAEPPQRKDELVTHVRGREGQVAAFVRPPRGELAVEEDFLIGLAQPTRQVLAEGERLGQVNVRIVLGLSALALLLAVLLARALSRPIAQIARAVRGFSPQAPQLAELPSTRSDELGSLARSVQDMQRQIHQQFEDLQRKQAEMDRLASHDSLTGLLNRRAFLDRLEHALAQARRSQGRLALLYIDLDHFKPINDQFGHAAGDTLLQGLALRLQHLVRASDTVARLGGDEFVLLIEQGAADDGALQGVAQKVLAALSEPVPFQGHALRCGGSIGIARFPLDGPTAGELLAAADQAMYRAKTEGRHQARFARQA